MKVSACRSLWYHRDAILARMTAHAKSRYATVIANRMPQYLDTFQSFQPRSSSNCSPVCTRHCPPMTSSSVQCSRRPTASLTMTILVLNLRVVLQAKVPNHCGNETLTTPDSWTRIVMNVETRLRKESGLGYLR